MKLVPDWKEAWKWFSVHAAVILAVINAAQASVPYVQSLLSPVQFAVVNAGLGIAIIWLRLLSQGQ